VYASEYAFFPIDPAILLNLFQLQGTRIHRRHLQRTLERGLDHGGPVYEQLCSIRFRPLLHWRRGKSRSELPVHCKINYLVIVVILHQRLLSSTTGLLERVLWGLGR
jgi:hypothetical protein